MFEIKTAYSEGASGDKLMVIDEERAVWLQRVGGLGKESGSCFKLVWQGHDISFDVHSKPEKNLEGDEYIVKRFSSFGDSGTGRYRFNIMPWIAESKEQRRQAMLLAVEALLAYGGFYDGAAKPDAYHRIKFEDHFYIKSDFGIP